MSSTPEDSDAADLVAHYEALNADDSGEYRARKYERLLGNDHPLLPALEPANEPSTPIDELVRQMETNGVVVLKNVLDPDAVARANRAHSNLVACVQKEIDDLTEAAFGEQARPGNSFYKGGEKNIGDLRITTTQKGRVDLKSLDRRDQGSYLSEQHPDVAESMEPLVMPPVVAELLHRCMGSPFRMTTFGSLPTQPHAVGGDWHRDIGEGLFGEDLDMQLPDYYFNAIIPLDDNGTAVNGTEMLLGSHRRGLDGLKDFLSLLIAP